jgi:ribosome-associated protein
MTVINGLKPMRSLTADSLRPELEFSTSRSSGPGGQNVNKVETRVTLRFDVTKSNLLSADEKALLLQKWSHRLTRDGILILTAQNSRSQSTNRDTVIQKLSDLLAMARRTPKARKATKASSSSRRKRVASKKVHGLKKKWRQKPDDS